MRGLNPCSVRATYPPGVVSDAMMEARRHGCLASLVSPVQRPCFRSSNRPRSGEIDRFLDSDVKANLTRLSKGELVLTHALYRQPVKTIFPRPAFRQQGT